MSRVGWSRLKYEDELERLDDLLNPISGDPPSAEDAAAIMEQMREVQDEIERKFSKPGQSLGEKSTLAEKVLRDAEIGYGKGVDTASKKKVGVEGLSSMAVDRSGRMANVIDNQKKTIIKHLTESAEREIARDVAAEALRRQGVKELREEVARRGLIEGLKKIAPKLAVGAIGGAISVGAEAFDAKKEDSRAQERILEDEKNQRKMKDKLGEDNYYRMQDQFRKDSVDPSRYFSEEEETPMFKKLRFGVLKK